VVDLNEAHLKAIEHLQKGGKSEILNLGTASGSSVMEILEEVKKATGKSFAIGQAQARQGDPARLIASNEKAKEVLNWQPKRSVADSIKTLLVWYKNHPKGWDR
jgi:UDP-glucose 4-epimerase